MSEWMNSIHYSTKKSDTFSLLSRQQNWKRKFFHNWLINDGSHIQSEPKIVSCCIVGCNFVNYGPILKEIPLLESLLNFQKDACNICHTFKMSPLHLAKWQTMTKWFYISVLWKLMDSKIVNRIINCIEQLTVN